MYNEPKRERYIVAAHDFGAGALANQSFKGEAGKKGILIDIEVSNISEAFANDTGGGTILVGTSADPDAYGLLTVADATAVGDTFRGTQDDTDAVIDFDLPADTQIEITGTQCTDSGTVAGIADVVVTVDWY